MSAREKILRFATHNEPTDGASVPIDPETGHMVMDVEAHVAGLLDEFVHELADKVGDRHSGTCGCGCDCSRFLDASAGPVRPGEEPTT